MVRAIKVIFAVAIFIFFATSVAYAFKTFYWGGGTIHQEITASGLMSQGVSEKSFKIIDEGNTWQDNPAPTLSVPMGKLFVSARHFDDNNISGGFKFVDEQYEYIKKEAANAYKDKKAYENVLYAFGEILHTMQDFYSHTNYVELHLKAKRVVPEDIKVVEKTHLSAGLKSGYFYYVGPTINELFIGPLLSRDTACKDIMEDNPGIPPFVMGEELEKRYNGFAGYINYATDTSISALHLDMNKDDSDSNAGKIVVPGTGKTIIYQYAYNLAVRETTRQWKYLEELIRKTHPVSANKIIYALKTGTIAEEGEACEGIEIAQAELSTLRQKASNLGQNITTLQNARTQANKVEAELTSISGEIENLRLKSSALSDNCTKQAAAFSAEVGRVKAFLSTSGEKVSVLRKTADALAITSCELAEKAQAATDPKKSSNHAYNCGQFAKQARKKAEEAKALVKQAAAMVGQLRGINSSNAAADELTAELNSLLARLKEQQAAVTGLKQWQANAELAYSSIQNLSLDADKASGKIQQILQACPDKAPAPAIINETEKVCDSIHEAHKQSGAHYNAFMPLFQRSSLLLSQNESSANALTKNITPCDKLKNIDLSDSLASVETMEVFAQSASSFAAKAESCASQAAAISKERQAPSTLEMVAQIQSDKNSYYPDETLTGIAWVRGGNPPYKSFGRVYGSGKKPEDVISFKWEAPIDAKPEEIGKPKKFAAAVYDAAGKRAVSNTIEVLILEPGTSLSTESTEVKLLEMTAEIKPDRNSYYADEKISGTAKVYGGQPPYRSLGGVYGSGRKPEDVVSFKWQAPIDAKPEEIGKPKKFVMEVFDATNKMVRSNIVEVMIMARPEPEPEPELSEQPESINQQSPASGAGDCTSCAYEKCPACADSMLIACESPEPDCQACIEANCR